MEIGDWFYFGPTQWMWKYLGDYGKTIDPQTIYKDHLKKFPDTPMGLYNIMGRIYRGWSIHRAINTPYLGHGGARNFKSNKKQG